MDRTELEILSNLIIIDIAYHIARQNLPILLAFKFSFERSENIALSLANDVTLIIYIVIVLLKKCALVLPHFDHGNFLTLAKHLLLCFFGLEVLAGSSDLSLVLIVAA